jgi:hypothetical protein
MAQPGHCTVLREPPRSGRYSAALRSRASLPKAAQRLAEARTAVLSPGLVALERGRAGDVGAVGREVCPLQRRVAAGAQHDGVLALGGRLLALVFSVCSAPQYTLSACADDGADSTSSVSVVL